MRGGKGRQMQSRALQSRAPHTHLSRKHLSSLLIVLSQVYHPLALVAADARLAPTLAQRSKKHDIGKARDLKAEQQADSEALLECSVSSICPQALRAAAPHCRCPHSLAGERHLKFDPALERLIQGSSMLPAVGSEAAGSRAAGHGQGQGNQGVQ